MGTIINIENILEQKGIEFYPTGKDNWIKMRCLLPGHEDKKPSFFINTEDYAYNCYKCGSGSLTELFKILEWKEDLQYLVGVTKPGNWRKLKEFVNGKNIINEIVPAIKPDKLQKIINDKKSEPYTDYLKSRKILFLLKEYEMFFTKYKSEHYGWLYRNRVLIPVQTPGGEYSFYEGRSIFEPKNMKYYRPGGIVTALHLFNYHRVIKKYGTKCVIVFEGIIDAMIAFVLGYPAVCSFGTRLSTEHILLLMDFDKIIIGYDYDEGGVIGYQEAIKQLKGTGKKLGRILLPAKVDLNKYLIKNGKEITINRLKKYKSVS